MEINIDNLPDISNASGYVFLIALQDYLRSGQPITLSFKDTTPPSTSFLNSSIGELEVIQMYFGV